MRSKLLIEHRRIELAIDRMEHLLDQGEEATLDALIDARWAYARQILAHLDNEETHVFAPLAIDPRPWAVETVTLFRAERDALAERFREHARRFWSDETIDADRPGYAAGLRPNLAAVRDMLRREERLLYPLLDEAMPAVAPMAGGGRWMADAWRFRAAAPAVR